MKIFSLTDIGRKREVNQDYVYVTDKPVGHIPNLFVVADGMGGHKAGDFASKYAVQVLEEHIRNNSGMGRNDYYRGRSGSQPQDCGEGEREYRNGRNGYNSSSWNDY